MAITGQRGVVFYLEGARNGGSSGIGARRLRVSSGNFFEATREQIKAMMEGLRTLKAGERLQGMIGKYVGQAIARNIRMQRNEDGSRFTPLVKKTRDDRAREGFPPGPPLIRGGGLFAAATSKLAVTASGAGLVIRPTLNSRTGYRKKNATVFQYWGTQQSMRSFFYLTDKDWRLIGDIMWSVVIGKATIVAKNTGMNDKVRATFDFRMSRMGQSNRDFLRSDSLIETTRMNINLLRME